MSANSRKSTSSTLSIELISIGILLRKRGNYRKSNMDKIKKEITEKKLFIWIKRKENRNGSLRSLKYPIRRTGCIILLISYRVFPFLR